MLWYIKNFLVLFLIGCEEKDDKRVLCYCLYQYDCMYFFCLVIFVIVFFEFYLKLVLILFGLFVWFVVYFLYQNKVIIILFFFIFFL